MILDEAQARGITHGPRAGYSAASPLGRPAGGTWLTGGGRFHPAAAACAGYQERSQPAVADAAVVPLPQPPSAHRRGACIQMSDFERCVRSPSDRMKNARCAIEQEHRFRTTLESCGPCFTSSCRPCSTRTNSSPSGSARRVRCSTNFGHPLADSASASVRSGRGGVRGRRRRVQRTPAAAPPPGVGHGLHPSPLPMGHPPRSPRLHDRV